MLRSHSSHRSRYVTCLVMGGFFFFFMGLLGIFKPVFAQETSSQAPYKVYIGQFIAHPALDAMVEGIKEVLNVEPQIETTLDNAQGNVAIATQMAQKFLSQRPAAVVSLTTPLTQVMINALKGQSIPIFYGAITDPVQTRIVDPAGKGDVWGIIDQPPFQDQIRLIREVTPVLSRLGVPYNPAEANSVTLVEALVAEAAKQGITVVLIPVPRSSEVISSIKGKLDEVDGFYLPQDNTVIAATDAIIAITQEQRKPVFSSVTEIVEKGALAAIGYNFKEMGKDVGRLVVNHLIAKETSHEAVQTPSQVRFFINAKTAALLGITLSADTLQKAEQVFH